jgi:F-type H+-transporting ATPase subunit delta
MRELIRGYGAACIESARDNDRLDIFTSDLRGFSRALTEHGSLRQVIVDPGIATRSRRDVVEDLLGKRATPEACGFVSFVVRAERASEIPTSIVAFLAVAETAVASKGVEPGSESATNRSGVRDRIRGFVVRVFQELDVLEDIDAIEDELFRIARLLDDYPQLRTTLQDPIAPYVGRAALLADLFEGRTRPTTFRITRYVCRAGRLRDLVATFDWLVELAAQERGRRVAEVRAAITLNASETTRLAGALGRLVDRTVEVRTILDPSVIGGVLISVGDLVIDGTVRLRVERLRDLLVSSN